MPNSAARPVPPALPTPEQVSLELQQLKRWVGWRAVWDDSKQKWRKPPCSPVTGERVGPVSKNAEHFVSFVEAIEGAKKHNLDGVGFVFAREDGFIGIDFDDCRDDDGIHPEVLSWLKWFPTYAEVSPSGTGVHIIARGKLAKALTATPLPGAEGVTVEGYSWDRYFTWTGQVLGELRPVAGCQVGLDKLLAHLGTKPAARDAESSENAPRALSITTVRKLHADNLTALRHAKQGEGNALLNQCSFFAARAFAAKALESTEVELKQQLLDIVTKEWAKPHPAGGAEQTITSGWSSGIGQPLVLKEEEWPRVAETIKSFNERFYVIENYGGRTRVAWEELSRISKGESYLLVTQSFLDFKNRFMNQLIQVGEKDDGSPRFEDKGTLWLKSSSRTQFEKVVFEPGASTPPHIRNLWRGFAYEAKKGNCDLYLTHLRENVCQDDEVKYKYLISWMAYAVRHPHEQGHVAIVLQGLKGVGKNVFAEGFANLWGQHGMVVSDQGRVTKNFNAHLRDKCVLICDEAFFAGDRRHEGVLKALITGATLTIEAKGVDAITVPNLLRLIIIGNDAWLVPASWEERRFLMLNCGAKQQQNQAYFQAINDQLNEGGYEALLHYLLHEVDLNGFNVREAPHTAELREQMSESLRGAELAWHECLYTGLIPGRVQKDGTVQLRTSDLVAWARSRDTGWSIIKPQHAEQLLGVNPRSERLGFGFEKSQPLSPGEQLRYFVLPPLRECRRLWDERRYKVDWPKDGGNWDVVAQEEAPF